MNYFKRIQIFFCFLFLLLSWSSFSFASREEEDQMAAAIEASKQEEERRQEAIVAGKEPDDSLVAAAVTASLEDQERQEVLAVVEEADVQKKVGESLDPAKEHAEKLRAFHANVDLRRDPAKRLFRLPECVNSGSIFYVRAIRQINNWMCGHLVLFHAGFIEQVFTHGGEITRTTLIDAFSPENYSFERFQDFYGRHSIHAYDELGGVREEDTLSGLICPSKGIVDNINYLNENQLKQIAMDLGFLDHFYILAYHRERGIDLAISEEPEKDLDLRSIVPACGGCQGYLTQKITALRETRRPWLIHFACFVGANHWVLISVVNSTGLLSDTKIILLDSFNCMIRENSHVHRYLSFIRDISIPQGLARRFWNSITGWFL